MLSGAEEIWASYLLSSVCARERKREREREKKDKLYTFDLRFKSLTVRHR